MPSSWRVQWPGLTEVNSVMQLVAGDYGLQVLVRLTSANEIAWGFGGSPREFREVLWRLLVLGRLPAST
jgi:hypothetical protein